ncbi:MAG TPA: carbonic anhydrase [Methylocella sp.]|nr:carbonic anhydrase [Methylocella sp.]
MPQTDLSPDAVTQQPGRVLLPPRLISGYEAFLGGRFSQEQERYHHLAETGQHPTILLIGCCDSRVSPEVIFDMRPGELFVVRNIANLVPPYGPNDDLHGTSAALEYAVIVLKVEHIVLMGHASCGGVLAYARQQTHHQEPLTDGDFIGKWIGLLSRAATYVDCQDRTIEDYVERLALASIVQGLVNLRTFPWIREREARGRLSLHGAYFGISEGNLLALHESSGRFLPIAAKAHQAAQSHSQTSAPPVHARDVQKI